MARIDLLPSGGCQYKANLHCHSHLSDGEFSPEKLRDIYREKGYSVLAVTDHNRLVEHSDLNREDFLMLTHQCHRESVAEKHPPPRRTASYSCRFHSYHNGGGSKLRVIV